MPGEQRRRRVADRDQPRRDEALGVVDADVRDAVEEDALQRERARGRRAEQASGTPRQRQSASTGGAGEGEAQRDADLGRRSRTSW